MKCQYGEQVENTHFIPIVLNNATIHEFVHSVHTEQKIKKFLIWIGPTQLPNEFNTKRMTVWQIKTTRNRIPFGTPYFQFKSVVATAYANYIYGKGKHIKVFVCTQNSVDLLGYFIIRWMLEEAKVGYNEVFDAYKAAINPGLTDEKYIAAFSQYQDLELTIPNVTDTVAVEPENNLSDIFKILENTEQKTPIPLQKTPDLNQYIDLNQPQEDETNRVSSEKSEEQQYNEIVRKICIANHVMCTGIPVLYKQKLTREGLEETKENAKESVMVLVPEYEGVSAILAITNGVKQIVCSNGTIINPELTIPESVESDTEIQNAYIEGVLYETEEKKVFIISDVLSYGGVNAKGMELTARLGYVVNLMIPARKAHPELTSKDRFEVDVRPLFPLSDGPAFFANLSRSPKYPVRGFSIGISDAVFGVGPDSTGWYTFLLKPQRPVVVGLVDYAKGILVGMTAGIGGLRSTVMLGPITQKCRELDGAALEIAFTGERDCAWKVVGKTDRRVWSYSMFEDEYPDGRPAFTYSEISEILSNM